MIFQKKTYQQLIEKLIGILLQVKQHVTDDSDCTWTYYETPEQMREEIDKYILGLEKGNTHFLDEINIHFAPTAGYQEHSMSNNWTVEYLKLAEEFDKIYEALKKS